METHETRFDNKADDTRPRVSHMTFPELLTYALGLGSKIDGLWQRIVYIHIGMAAAVIFLARSDEPYYAARFLVLVFYTFNIFITYWNMRDAYEGLQRAVDDMKTFPNDASDGATSRWIKSRQFARNSRYRAVVLVLFWIPVAYLLMMPAFNIPGLKEIGTFQDNIQRATPQKLPE